MRHSAARVRTPTYIHVGKHPHSHIPAPPAQARGGEHRRDPSHEHEHIGDYNGVIGE